MLLASAIKLMTSISYRGLSVIFTSAFLLRSRVGAVVCVLLSNFPPYAQVSERQLLVRVPEPRPRV